MHESAVWIADERPVNMRRSHDGLPQKGNLLAEPIRRRPCENVRDGGKPNQRSRVAEQDAKAVDDAVGEHAHPLGGVFDRGAPCTLIVEPDEHARNADQKHNHEKAEEHAERTRPHRLRTATGGVDRAIVVRAGCLAH